MSPPLLDRYAWTARVAPAILVVLPLWLVLAAFPSSRGSMPSILVGSVGGAALMILAAQWAGDAGRRRERGLYRQWGGPPTTRLLRHRTSSLPRPTLARYHAKLGDLLGDPLPSPEGEAADPRAADDRYAAGVGILRERTRISDRFPALNAALADYGFRRNTWGLRPAGLSTSLVGVLGCGLAASRQTSDAAAVPAVLAVASAALFVVWWRLVQPSWIRRGADSYAHRLLGALDSLPSE